MKPKVFVLGELNVDLIATGTDVMPEWNREKLIDTFDMVLGSSSAITACGLAGLGLDVCFVSAVGKDHFGSFCLEQLETKGVDTSHVIVNPELQTGVTLSVSTKVDRALLTYMGAIPHLRPENLPDRILEDASHIHFGSYFLQEDMRPHWYQLFERAHQREITTSFDTGWDPEGIWHKEELMRLLDYTTLFIPSEEELSQILDTDSFEQSINQLSGKQGMVAIKRGSRGAVMVDESGNQHKVNAFDIVPIDTTGAGDSFNSGLIYGFLAGKTGTDLLEFANACGALATQRIGGASHAPTVEDVQSFRKEHSLGGDERG